MEFKNAILLIYIAMIPVLISCGGGGNDEVVQAVAGDNDINIGGVDDDNALSDDKVVDNLTIEPKSGTPYHDNGKLTLASGELGSPPIGESEKVFRKIRESKEVIAEYGISVTLDIPENILGVPAALGVAQDFTGVNLPKEHTVVVYDFNEDVLTVSDAYFVSGKHKEQKVLEGNVAVILNDDKGSVYMYTFTDPRTNVPFNHLDFPHQKIDVEKGYFTIKVPVSVVTNSVSGSVVEVPLNIELGSAVDENIKRKILIEGKEIYQINVDHISNTLYPLL